jgi:hypothetical protein
MVQEEIAVSDTSGTSVNDCQGFYQYDGQGLVVRLSRCTGMPVGKMIGGGTTGGPISFQGPNVFTWGDATYQRQ